MGLLDELKMNTGCCCTVSSCCSDSDQVNLLTGRFQVEMLLQTSCNPVGETANQAFVF